MNIIVLGMHRSGTSAVAGALRFLGMQLPADEELLPPQPDNPMGFFEPARLVAFNDALLNAHDGEAMLPPNLPQGWEHTEDMSERRAEARAVFAETMPPRDWVWKDPRNALTLPFWHAILEEPTLHLHVYRHPVAVARSLRKRDDISIPLGIALWERYNRDALINSAGRPVIVTSFAELLRDPIGWGRALAKDLTSLGARVGDVDGEALGGFIANHPPDEVSPADHDDLSTNQRMLLDLLSATEGPHTRFSSAPPDLTPWAEQLIEEGLMTRAATRSQSEWQKHHQELMQVYQAEVASKPFWWRKARGAYRRARERISRASPR